LQLVQSASGMNTFRIHPLQKWNSRVRLGAESLGADWGLPERRVLLAMLTTDGDDGGDSSTALAAPGAEGLYLGITSLRSNRGSYT
jgi:hypothetical protein